MKLHPAVAVAMVAIILGSSTIYLTRAQYESAYFCDDGRIKVGSLKDNSTLLEKGIAQNCSTHWTNLEKVCGKFWQGKSYHLTFKTEACDTVHCVPTSCEVS